MKMYDKLIPVLLVSSLLISTFCSSCIFNELNTTEWVVDQSGFFHTTDVERAQKEIPFTIIFPNYLPPAMGTDYWFQIDGPTKNKQNLDVDIEISYVKENRRIYITERNILVIVEPNSELDPIYFDIAGTRVLRQKAQLAGGSGITEGVRFDWNQDDLRFAVQFFSINEEEAIKVVESMVVQTE